MNTDATFRMQTFSQWKEIEHLRPEWEELLESSSAKTIFLTYEWLASWWNAYGDGKELLFITVRNNKEKLLAIAPLFEEERRLAGKFPARVLKFVGDGTTDSVHLNFLIRAGEESACVIAILEFLRQRPRWNILELNTLAIEATATSAIVDALEQPHWRVIRKEMPRLAIALPNTWEKYLAMLSARMAETIVSTTHTLNNSFNVEFRRCGDRSQMLADLDQLFAMHTARWDHAGKKGAFESEERRRFYRLLAEQLLEKGYLDFWWLYLNGQPAAAEFGLRFGDTYSFLQAGFATEFQRYSVGKVLRGLIIKALIAEGIKVYDFLAGDELYKLRSGAKKSSFINLRCARSRSVGAIYLEMIKSKQFAKALLTTKA